MSKLETQQNEALLKLIARGIAIEDAEMIKGAIDLGADVTALFNEKIYTGAEGVTVLHVAGIRNAKEDIILMLVQAAGHADVRDKGGATPLHAAARRGSLDAIDMLLRCGASPVAMADSGKTPIDLAQENLSSLALDAVLRKLATSRPDPSLVMTLNKKEISHQGSKEAPPATQAPVRLLRPVTPTPPPRGGGKTLKLD